jgi:hypothetical protein
MFNLFSKVLRNDLDILIVSLRHCKCRERQSACRSSSEYGEDFSLSELLLAVLFLLVLTTLAVIDYQILSAI